MGVWLTSARCLLNMVVIFTVALTTVAFLASSSFAAECHGKPNPNVKPNLNPVQTGPPVLVRTTRNGKLFRVGDEDDSIDLVHVWGSPYEMGYAHGRLQQERAVVMMNEVWKYLQEEVVKAINSTATSFLPDWFLDDVAELGLEAALDLEYEITRAFSGSYFEEEIKGLAAGAGCSAKLIRRVNMIGELTKGSCSMFGANATATKDGHLLQLRALDWDVDGPFKNYPQITVYHPNSGRGESFANIGWTGLVGSITGVSSKKNSISEIGVSFPDETFGKESRFGTPFMYLLRDILQFEDTLQGAMDRISTAKRTCYLILGVGDGKVNEFRGVEYSASVADFFTYDNLRPTEDWHPKIQDIVYWGMDWLCPSYNQVLAKLLTTYHGNLTAELTISQIVPIVQTGDLHTAVYDHQRNLLFVANARGDGEAGPKMAYDRAFVRLVLDDVFAVHPSTD